MSERLRRGCVLLGYLLFVPSLAAEEKRRLRTPSEQYAALIKEYEAADAEYSRSSRKVTPADPAWPEHYAAWPMWSFARRFLQFAEANPKEPCAVDSLLKIVGFLRTGRQADRFLFPLCTRAMTLLSGDHLQDDRVVQACLTQVYAEGPAMEPYFRTLLARSRDREVRGWACWALIRSNELRLHVAERPWFDHPEYERPDYRKSTAFLHDRLDPEYVKYIRTTDPVAISSESEALLERVINEFGDVPYAVRWVEPSVKARLGGRTLADLARPKLDALRSLGVGKVAPDIQGEDIDGKPMKLSDYRGKIVVLVFWGTWCGPCMGFLPSEKALVQRLKNRPFALLGLNSDSDRAKLRAAMEKEGITWWSWWDGGKTGGPIATRWDVHTWPTIIVLDEKGVIRFKHLPHFTPKPLDDAVDSLLSALRPPPR